MSKPVDLNKLFLLAQAAVAVNFINDEGNEELDLYPQLNKGFLNTRQRDVENYIKNNFGKQNLNVFFGIVKKQFSLEEGEKFTPQMWQDAVNSLKKAYAGEQLSDQEDAPADASYANATDLVVAVGTFAEELGVEKVQDFSNATDLCEKLGLQLPENTEEAATEEETETVEAETEAKTEQPLKDEAKSAPAKKEETPAKAEKETLPAITGNVPVAAVQSLANSFDQLDEMVERSEQQYDQLLETARKNNAETRKSVKSIRKSMVEALVGATLPEEVTED